MISYKMILIPIINIGFDIGYIAIIGWTLITNWNTWNVNERGEMEMWLSDMETG